MDRRLLGLVILAVWGVPFAAAILASIKHTAYLPALRTCALWGALVLGFMLLNYHIADALGVSSESSGYARGRKVASPYGFLVQLLLIVEILAVAVVKRWLSSRRE